MAPARAVGPGSFELTATTPVGTFVPAPLLPACPSEIIAPRYPSGATTILPPTTGAVSRGQQASVSYAQFYEEHRELVDGTIASICRRNRLSQADADDFMQEAHMKLMQPSVLEAFQKRSSLETYLRVVLQNLYRDIRNSELGKWRPSVEAKGNGPVAVLFERLVVRDRLSFDEALETLRINHDVTESREKLEALAARLPIRRTRRPIGDEALAGMPDGRPLPDTVLSIEQHQAYVEHGRHVLQDALGKLDPEERLPIKLRYIDGLKVVAIASLLKVDAKRLYHRIEQLLERLRVELETRGIDSTRLFDDEAPWG